MSEFFIIQLHANICSHKIMWFYAIQPFVCINDINLIIISKDVGLHVTAEQYPLKTM